MSYNDSLTKIFNVSGKFFAFCGRSNRIFKISSVMADILNCYESHTKEEIISLLSGTYKPEEIEDSLAKLDHLTSSYGFLDTKPLNQRLNSISKERSEDLLSKDILGICLETTESCNFRCRYCSFSGGYPLNRLHGAVNMNWNTAKTAIDFYHSKNKESFDIRPSIGFYGGEPLLNIKLIRQSTEYVKHLKWDHPLGVQWNITTNGSLLTKNMIRYLIDNSFSITISIDGPSFEHNKNRVFANGQPTFDQVFKNVSLLYEMAPRDYYNTHILVNCVFSPDTDLLAVNEFFIKNHYLFSNVMTSTVRIGHETFFQEHILNPDRRKYEMDILFKHYVEAHISSEPFNPKSPNNVFIRSMFERDFIKIHKRDLLNTASDQFDVSPACFPGKRKLFVDLHGNIHICERVNRTYPIGDVINGFDIDKVIFIANDYSQVMNSDKCRSCWAFRFCNLCYAPLLENKKITRISDETLCTSIKNNTLRSLKSYCFILERNAHAFEYMKNYVVI